MIKQSKTTIKELTAQYRAVLKHAFLAGVAAVAVSTTGAMALPRFDAAAVKGSDVTGDAATEYFYTAGGIETIIDTIQTQKPDGTDFGFKNPDGTDVTLDVNGATTLTADSYAKASAAETSDVVTWAGGTTVKYNSDIDKGDYSFKTQKFTVDGSGNVTFGGDGKAITEAGTDVLSAGAPADVVAKYTFSTLNTGFTGQQTITSSTAIDATKYQQNVGTSVVLHLNDDGTKILDAEGHDVSLVPDYQTAFTALKTAYDTDKKHLSAIQTALTTVNQYNSDNYGTADGVYNADSTLKNNLSTWQGEFAQAKSDFSDAAGAYDVSLGKAIDSRILNEDGAVAKAVTNLIDTKEDLLSADIGYDLGNPDDAEKGLVARLDALTADSADKTLVGAINANTDAIAQVRSDAEAAWEKGEAWISQELGYDTKTTDAKTELAEAGFESTDFLGAVTENKEAIAQVRSDAEAAWEKGEAWISQELGYDTKTTDAKTELAEAGFESTDFLGALQELDQTDLALSGQIADEATRAMEEEAAIRSEFAAADELTLSSAKAFANAGDELTLSKANAYTDAKVDTLEKNVSGGIAAATALSAVEVSNVKRGEMSVGGGYGYYNGASAGAFGMALGLSDNWSVNAGAGIASGDKTQVSFRAGTNYKFKLF